MVWTGGRGFKRGSFLKYLILLLLLNSHRADLGPYTGESCLHDVATGGIGILGILLFCSTQGFPKLGAPTATLDWCWELGVFCARFPPRKARIYTGEGKPQDPSLMTFRTFYYKHLLHSGHDSRLSSPSHQAVVLADDLFPLHTPLSSPLSIFPLSLGNKSHYLHDSLDHDFIHSLVGEESQAT